MSQPEVHKSASKGMTQERGYERRARCSAALPPDADVLIDDLTADEDRLFLAAILEA